MRAHSHRSGSWLLLPAGLGALTAVAPLLYLVRRSTEQGVSAIAEELGRPQTRTLLFASVRLTVAATLLCVLVGVGAAWLVAMTNLAGRRVLEVLLALPLAVPTYVAAYTWLATFDRVEGFRGALGVLVVCSYPYVYLPVLAALRRIDPAGAEVARSLGARPIAVFFRVVLPQLRPAITSGALLVALYVLSDFGAVSLMRFDTLTQGIYLSYVGAFDRTPAAILGCVLVAVASVLVGLEMRNRGRISRAKPTARSARRSPAPVLLGRWRFPSLAAVLALLTVAIGVPVLALGRWFGRSANGGVEWALLRRTIASTLTAATLGAVACTVLAVPIGLLVTRHRSRLSSALEGASYVSHALPGLVIALSMVFLGVRYLTPIYQRLPLLVIAYVALFLPLAVAAVRTSLAQSPPALEEVARSLGIGPTMTMWRVTLPLATPGIAAGAALVALTCMKELPATLLLRPTSFETLATRVWTDTSVADYGRAAPSAIAMLVLGALPMLVLNRSLGQ